MNCTTFQDSLSDYLDSALDSRMRAECAAHRLICRQCREIYNEVKDAVNSLSEFRDIHDPRGLEDRILDATTAGEMLNCEEFDLLLEQYFDGVILAPTYKTLLAHFETCLQCRRLHDGIQEAIDACREIKNVEVEISPTLHDKIVAATLGASAASRDSLFTLVKIEIQRLATPQITTAMLIFAAALLLILSRFGSFENMANQAGKKAGSLANQTQRAIIYTGSLAGFGVFDSPLPQAEEPIKEESKKENKVKQPKKDLKPQQTKDKK